MQEQKDDNLIDSQSSETENKQKVLTIEDLYHNVLRKAPRDGCGKYQWFMFVTVCTGLCGFGYIEYGLGYYELFPVYNCVLDNSWVENCSV